MERYDLVCIGCGPAGEKAATQAAYFKRRVAIIEQQRRPGGAMVNTGTLPSKALRETALLHSALSRRGLGGGALHGERTLSVPRLMAHRHRIEEEEHDRIEASMDRHGIDVHFGRGRLLDGHTVVVTREDGSTFTIRGEHILVATGSSPLRPAHVPFDHPAVCDADGVLELERLPESMIIVGAGVIGCEYASIFAEIDVRVTLINPSPNILPFIDGECREHLLRAMADAGIDLRLGASVAGVKAVGPRRVQVTFEGGGALDADCLLWAAGRSSNTADLGLERVGVQMGERGLVRVDHRYRTNVPSIYAAGDVIGFPALAATSMEQGRIAACDMFGISFKGQLASAMPIGIYTIPALSMVGQTEAQAAAAGTPIVVGRALYRYNARGRMLGDEQGIVKCVFERTSRRLIGATIAGQDATELIHLAACVMQHGGGIDSLVHACFNYPSLSELYKYTAYSALQQLAHEEGREDQLAARARVA